MSHLLLECQTWKDEPQRFNRTLQDQHAEHHKVIPEETDFFQHITTEINRLLPGLETLNDSTVSPVPNSMLIACLVAKEDKQHIKRRLKAAKARESD